MLYQVDVFTTDVFKGNPAGVYLSDRPLKPDFMQNIALEMNLSETGFTWLEDGKRQIRYFTPTVEVPLCGHATLAVAHILFEQEIIKEDSLVFQALKNSISVKKEGDNIGFTFPKVHSTRTEENLDDVIGLKASLNYKALDDWHISVLDSEAAVKNAEINLGLLKEKCGHLMIMAKGNEVDYVLRLFAPASGISEDPVTGFAQTVVAPIWQDLVGGTKFKSKQVSKRGGYLEAEIKGENVVVTGKAVTVFKIESLF